MLFDNLTTIQRTLRENSRESREGKVEILRKIIKDIESGSLPEWKGLPSSFIFLSFLVVYKSVSGEPLYHPLNPEVTVVGMDPNGTTIFKSATQPMAVTFRTTKNTLYRAIFKIGDDLRQDQLVIQLIQLMDKLLKKNGFDLKLTPYRVLACSTTAGFVECVTPSTSLFNIIEQAGTFPSIPSKRYPKETDPIRRWLWEQLQDEEAYQEACKNFVKSCGMDH
jgi:phosphatidylinositol kinase/protein kinase (PI-3  family)